MLCPSLCLPASKNIIGCELVRKRTKKREEPTKSNLPYNLANCYLCFKELKGAGKHSTIKNRNNPSFWGIKSEFKILCLKCLGKKFYGKLSPEKRKTWNKYVKRGYE